MGLLFPRELIESMSMVEDVRLVVGRLGSLGRFRRSLLGLVGVSRGRGLVEEKAYWYLVVDWRLPLLLA